MSTTMGLYKENAELLRRKYNYSHDPPNIVLNGARKAFPSRAPMTLAALLMAVPIATDAHSYIDTTCILQDKENHHSLVVAV